MSIPFSFTSLVLASTHVFYNLRHGSFSDPDPTIKMILCVIPFTSLLVAGPLITLILIATYFRGYIFIYVLVIIGINFAVIKSFFMTAKCKEAMVKLFHHYKIYRVNAVAINKAINFIFLATIFTSWVSPSAVWLNNFETKSYLLIVLSALTMLCHSLGVVSIYLFIHNNAEFTITQQPIFHCFLAKRESFNSSSHKVIFAEDGLIHICQNNCMPHLRLCSANEDPSFYFFNYVGPIAFTLLFCSLLSAMVLQVLGNYYNMYHWSKILFCNHPIIHIGLVKDILKNMKNLPRNMKTNLNLILEQGLEQEEKMFIFEENDNVVEWPALLTNCPRIRLMFLH